MMDDLDAFRKNGEALWGTYKGCRARNGWVEDFIRWAACWG